MLLTKAKLSTALARIVNYDSFIVQATVTMIVNYDRNMFIAQATSVSKLTNNSRIYDFYFLFFLIFFGGVDSANSF